MLIPTMDLLLIPTPPYWCTVLECRRAFFEKNHYPRWISTDVEFMTLHFV